MNPDRTVSGIQARVRPAEDADRGRLANLCHFGGYIHRHLDWRPALDWLGAAPFLLAEQGKHTLAALACPPETPGVAWVRMFAAADGAPVEKSWELLWEPARAALASLGVRHVAAIPLDSWFQSLLSDSGFQPVHDVVVLVWHGEGADPDTRKADWTIRPMQTRDLPEVQALDAAAFGDLWRISIDSLQLAFQQAAVATVAEDDRDLLGYQISTHGPYGAHLARLAVRAEVQNRGIGSGLVRDLQQRYQHPPLFQISVNTQNTNAASLALYHKAGFRATGEGYPVFQFDLP